MPRVIPASRASSDSASTVARSAPGGAITIGRLLSAGATRPSTVVQNEGGSIKRIDFIIENAEKISSRRTRSSAKTAKKSFYNNLS
jgi:hypothetical protein